MSKKSDSLFKKRLKNGAHIYKKIRNDINECISQLRLKHSKNKTLNAYSKIQIQMNFVVK